MPPPQPKTCFCPESERDVMSEMHGRREEEHVTVKGERVAGSLKVKDVQKLHTYVHYTRAFSYYARVHLPCVLMSPPAASASGLASTCTSTTPPPPPAEEISPPRWSMSARQGLCTKERDFRRGRARSTINHQRYFTRPVKCMQF